MVIQRSWKILNENGSNSASSTEANRSPASAINSSSDDSNCSNQTTHSMVTSLASPTNKTHTKHEPTLISQNTTSTFSAAPDAMKFVTTPQMAESTLLKLRQRYTQSATSSSAESVMRSLELVRITVQGAFDKEVNELVKKYIDTYFRPAYNNIKENLGQGSVNEDALQKMSCAMLENAKSQYKCLRFKTTVSTNSGTNPLQSTSQDHAVQRFALKRPATGKLSGELEMQKRFLSDSTQVLPPVSTLKSTLIQNSATPYMNKMLQSTVACPTITTAQPMAGAVVAQTQLRRQIFWNTANISTTTQFVLDVQANQAFGFTEGKDRLASKHPELIRYLPDNQDREWLISQNLISQQSRSSRFLFLIFDEVCRLYQTHDIYKSRSNIDLSLMIKFNVPEFMIQKMKIFFVDLNIKSRGLITNSFSLAQTGTQNVNANSNSHLRNALLLGAQSTLLPSSSNSNNTIVTESSSTSITSSDCLIQSKPKSSNLSSSHATLTALLNNSATSSTSPASNLPSSVNTTTTTGSPTLLNKLRK